ncbi:GHMP kinase [bacterium]|nr:GHMP kinase [bacterium]
MIITQTPFRISFVGGGSDMAAFYMLQTGAVLSTGINRYMYLSSHRFFEPGQIRAKYSQTETVERVAELKHPIIRTALEMMGIEGGIEISSIADVPSGTGMGSSSSFTVGLLHNLSVWSGRYWSKDELARVACEIEIERLGEPIGKQDQYAAAFGGLNLIEFLPDGSVRVEPQHMPAERKAQLESRLLMYYTGTQRSASAILGEQKNNVTQSDKFAALSEMVSLVYELRKVLYEGDLDDFGRILHQNWQLKKALASGISNGPIDQAYASALKAGALGGKLLGAGGGGFLLFYCREEVQSAVSEALSSLRPFSFRFENEGSKLIHYGH